MELNVLAVVFVIKSLFTLFVWCIPLLLFPSKLLELFGISEPISIIFLRLLGMAYAALMVGYVFGLLATLQDIMRLIKFQTNNACSVKFKIITDIYR